MPITTTALFVCLDDFAKTFEDRERRGLIPNGRKRRRAGKLSLGGMLFVMVLFHLSPFKDFKHFRVHGVEQKYRDCFSDLPSYARFVALMPRLFAPFCVLIHSLSGEQTGIYIADSTRLAVCANPRQSAHQPQPHLQRAGGTGAFDHGLVLRLQIACGDGSSGRIDGDQDHARQYRRPRTARRYGCRAGREIVDRYSVSRKT